MNEPTKAIDALNALTPVGPMAEFERSMWPAVKAALDRGVTLTAIYRQLHSEQLINISFQAFSKRVRKMREKEDARADQPALTAASAGEPIAAAPLDRTIQHAGHTQSSNQEGSQTPEAPDDKANRPFTEAGSALEQAQEQVRKTDYAKLARQARRK